MISLFKEISSMQSTNKAVSSQEAKKNCVWMCWLDHLILIRYDVRIAFATLTLIGALVYQTAT